MRHLAVWLAAALVGAFVAGCSSEEKTPEGPGDSGALSIEAFSAVPTTITPGGETILSWKTKNATSIRIYDDRDEVRHQSTKNEDSTTLILQETTTFRLVAQNAANQKVEHTGVTVTVREDTGPEVTFAGPARIEFGTSGSLIWDTRGADRVVITDTTEDEILVDTDDVADAGKFSGSKSISPDRTTVYELVATAEGVPETKKPVEVIVDPVISEFGTTTLERPVPVGTPVEVSWKTKGADSLVLSTPEGEIYEVPESERSNHKYTIVVGASGLINLTATRGKGEKVREYKVPLKELPVIEAFAVTPEAINAGQPTSVVVNWKVSNADSVRIVPDSGPAVVEEGELEGSRDYSATATTVLTLVASNAAGESTEQVTILAVPRPEILSFKAVPNRVVSNQKTRLVWSTQFASELTLTKNDGLETPIEIPEGDSGFVEVPVSVQTVFTLTAKNLANSEVTESATITIGPPIIDTFTVGQNRYSATEHIVLSWTGSGGTSAKVNAITRDAEGEIATSTEVCSATYPADASSGECDAGVRADMGRYEFQLVLADAVTPTPNKAQAFVKALVSDGPVITVFSASAPRINMGDEVSLTWTVLNDAAGNLPEIAITDSNGDEVDLEDQEASQGRINVKLETAGVHRFTLTATSDGGATFADAATIAVEALRLPEITAFRANPSAIEAGESTTLSWQIRDATSATIYEIDGTNQRAIYSIGTSNLRRGSHRLTPNTASSSITYRLIATNAVNKSAQDDAVVTIGNFSLTVPNTATAGDTVVITWDAPSPVTISPVFNAPVEITDSPFEDISVTGTEVTMDLCGDDPEGYGELKEGCGSVVFPIDFTFPFGGYEQAAVDAYVNGLLSFNVGNYAQYTFSYSSSAFPTGANLDYVHLGPLWSDFDLSVNADSGIFWERRTDAAGDRMIVQWTDVFSHGDDDDLRDSSFTFQAVLWSDGAVDYRFGTIVDDVTDLTRGRSATIGYQLPSQLHSHSLTTPSSSLQNRTWRYFRADYPASGTASFVVDETTIFGFCVQGPSGPECRQRTVVVN